MTLSCGQENGIELSVKDVIKLGSIDRFELGINDGTKLDSNDCIKDVIKLGSDAIIELGIKDIIKLGFDDDNEQLQRWHQAEKMMDLSLASTMASS
eukprot:7982257-Ditylum_brightwellii.AAC.1